MRYAFKVFIFVLLIASIGNAQDLLREQKLQKIEELNNQMKALETDVILPAAEDIKKAQEQGFNVFRIMPHEKYDGVFTIRGGAAYYSFSKKAHNYNSIPQIELSSNKLSVGFAGADYGFIAYLGKIPLSTINRETAGVSFLIEYKPPTVEEEAVNEKLRRGFEIDGINFNREVSAVVGCSYVLRAITFGQADVLVALNIYRKDTDGSLIIFWKLIDTFETPYLEKNQTSQNKRQNPETENSIPDYVMAQAIQIALLQNGFGNVSVDATNTQVTLRGTVPKGKLAEVVRTAQEVGKRKINNEVREQ